MTLELSPVLQQHLVSLSVQLTLAGLLVGLSEGRHGMIVFQTSIIVFVPLYHLLFHHSTSHLFVHSPTCLSSSPSSLTSPPSYLLSSFLPPLPLLASSPPHLSSLSRALAALSPAEWHSFRDSLWLGGDYRAFPDPAHQPLHFTCCHSHHSHLSVLGYQSCWMYQCCHHSNFH